MNVTLIRRWGPNRAGASVDVDTTMGQWLISHGFGVAGRSSAAKHAADSTSDDALAGGDPTRGRAVTVKSPRGDNPAADQPGAPSPYRMPPPVPAAVPAEPAGTSGGTPATRKATPTPRTSGGRRRKAD